MYGIYRNVYDKIAEKISKDIHYLERTLNKKKSAISLKKRKQYVKNNVGFKISPFIHCNLK